MNKLLFLHGIGRLGRDFLPILPWFQEFQGVLWDHRGHGQSKGRGDQFRIIDYANDVIGWLRKNSTVPIVIYGHSLGALVAIRVAAAEPSRVKAVILEDPPSPNFIAQLRQSSYFYLFTAMRRLASSQADVASIAAEFADTRLGPSSDALRLGDIRDAVSIRFSAHALKSVNPAVFDPLLSGNWFDDFDFEDSLRAMVAPTLLLYGESQLGGMLPKQDAEWMEKNIRHVVAVPVAGVGHLLHWQALIETVRHVIAFLETTS